MNVSCPSCQRNYVVADEQIAGKQFRARCKSCGVEFRLDGTLAGEGSDEANAPSIAKFMSATEAYLALQSSPPASAGTWSVCVNQTDTRKMTTEEIVQALNKGTITTSVFVWKSGMPKWLRLADVPELVSAGTKLTNRPAAANAATETELPRKGDAANRTSKPVPPNRGNGNGVPAQSSSPSASIPPRSGQTMPPPAATTGASASPDVGKAGVQAATVTTATRRSTPAPPRRALEIPIDVEMPEEAAAPGREPTKNVAAVSSEISSTTAEAPRVANEAATGDSPKGSPATTPERVLVPGDVILPPITGASVPRASTAAFEAPGRKGASEAAPQVSKPPRMETAAATPLPTSPPKAKRKRFGTVAALLTVGSIGVIGGVSGAVYVMKAKTDRLPAGSTSAAIFVHPPRAALPVPASTGSDVALATSSAAPPGAVDAEAAPPLASTTVSGSGKTRNVAVGARAPHPAVSRVARAPDSTGEVATSSPSQTDGNASTVAATAPFNREAAMAVLGLAATRAASCKKPNGPTGTARVHVTFDPSGSVVIANVVGEPIAGTAVAQCVTNVFRRVRIAPFAGERSSLARDVTIAP